jgi:predicted component of type VI protein secretion system
MNIKLVVENDGRRKVFTMQTTTAVIGRAHGNAFRIPSAQVSRRHCRLLVEGGLVKVEDMESVNGTFLNGRRIKGTEYVRPGDRLEVGPVAFTVEYEPSPEGLKRLRGEEEEDSVPVLEALEALADGEVMDLEDLPMVEAVDDEVADAEEATDLEPVRPPSDHGALEPDFDFEASPWQLPQGDDLRDLLSQMEDGDEPPPKPKKKR